MSNKDQKSTKNIDFTSRSALFLYDWLATRAPQDPVWKNRIQFSKDVFTNTTRGILRAIEAEDHALFEQELQKWYELPEVQQLQALTLVIDADRIRRSIKSIKSIKPVESYFE